ncbi:MAG: transporter substrate-binding domain-containing protein [Anaerolineales bacterium]|nr:transporter substrate-binding domain-containing protein [Anaerolineales bacterium]
MKNLSKHFVITLACMLVIILTAGCAGPVTKDVPGGAATAAPVVTESQPTAKGEASSAAKTIQLVTLQYPPYEFEENGQIKGIAVDIVTEAFKRMGYEVKISLYPWARSLEIMKNGEADAIFTAYKTPDREVFLEYSQEILMPQIVSLFVLKDSNITFDGDLSKLSQYRFGVVRAVSYGEKFDTLAKNKTLMTDEADTGEMNMDKLLKGRIDILVSNKYGALYILKQKGALDQVKELSPDLQSVPSYIAFSKVRNLTAVKEEFDKILAEMVKDGSVDKFINAYAQ